MAGHYPEKLQPTESLPHKVGHYFTGRFKFKNIPQTKVKQILSEVHKYAQQYEELPEAELHDNLENIQSQLHQNGLTHSLTLKAFALIREFSWRMCNMRHFDCQLIGGWIMVHGGLAEMETGEGKTFTAILAAATAALAGIPVHIITVNDYLVVRDAQLMEPIYNALGLTVNVVTADMDGPSRRAAYRSDITYCTNKQLAFDYLRDRILLGDDRGRLKLQLEGIHNDNTRSKQLYLRGLCFAIVDEADSVLIDEARTPLIISKEVGSAEEKELYLVAMQLSENLQIATDFIINYAERRVELSETGSKCLQDAGLIKGGVWRGKRRREELVSQALSAKYLFEKDHHYIVVDGKVSIVDQNTGRVMADRSWEGGLHQLIEIKEGCEITGRRDHLARLTYQRFFRRYICLAGMTGTAMEVSKELWSVYRLPVVKVFTNKQSQRVNRGSLVYSGKNEKWKAIVARLILSRQQGRPVLVGTRSVADSEYLSQLLNAESIPHQILNAKQDGREAEIVATAGEKGNITVATNMAGRGTDIPLGEGVVALGGLHVISTEINEARRIDRQLYGRCARQGDPGSYEVIFSLEDEMLQLYLGYLSKKVLSQVWHAENNVLQKIGLTAQRLAQRSKERQHRGIRRNLLQMEKQLSKALAFSGQLE